MPDIFSGIVITHLLSGGIFVDVSTNLLLIFMMFFGISKHLAKLWTGV